MTRTWRLGSALMRSRHDFDFIISNLFLSKLVINYVINTQYFLLRRRKFYLFIYKKPMENHDIRVTHQIYEHVYGIK